MIRALADAACAVHMTGQSSDIIDQCVLQGPQLTRYMIAGVRRALPAPAADVARAASNTVRVHTLSSSDAAISAAELGQPLATSSQSLQTSYHPGAPESEDDEGDMGGLFDE